MDAPVGSLYQRRALLAAGFTDHELRRLRRDGELSRIRRGAYLASSLPRYHEDQHRLLVYAAKTELAANAVISHASAAVMHGLPTWAVTLRRVRITRAKRSGGRRHPLVHMCTAPLQPDEVVDVGGLPVTSIARTIADLARTASFESAVIAADAALARFLVTREELAAATARAKGGPGVPRARRVVSFADGRGESVGESRSSPAIAMAGLPDPTQQWELHAHDGQLVARTDFCWEEWRVAGEFDGQIKYGRLLAPDQSAGDAIFAEKRREDEVRAEGYAMVRWTWDDLTPFAPTANRLRRHLTR